MLKKLGIVLSLILLVSCVSPGGYRTIEGVVDKVEFTNSFSYTGTIVYFKDGRVKNFTGISNDTFSVGRLHVIRYVRNDFGEEIIYSVSIVQ